MPPAREELVAPDIVSLVGGLELPPAYTARPSLAKFFSARRPRLTRARNALRTSRPGAIVNASGTTPCGVSLSLAWGSAGLVGLRVFAIGDPAERLPGHGPGLLSGQHLGRRAAAADCPTAVAGWLRCSLCSSISWFVDSSSPRKGVSFRRCGQHSRHDRDERHGDAEKIDRGGKEHEHGCIHAIGPDRVSEAEAEGPRGR